MKLSLAILLFAVILLGAVLRFYNISNNPPGLYLDEASIGLNAYDILKTGKDQYGYSTRAEARCSGCSGPEG